MAHKEVEHMCSCTVLGTVSPNHCSEV